MSYNKAKRIFNKSLKYVDAKDDPFRYCLVSGLSELARALEVEMQKIQRSISQIETSLKRLR